MLPLLFVWNRSIRSHPQPTDTTSGLLLGFFMSVCMSELRSGRMIVERVATDCAVGKTQERMKGDSWKADRRRSGLGGTTTSQWRPTLRQGCTCWVPTGDHGISNKNCHYISKGGLHGRSCQTQSGTSECIWAELHETGRLSATLAVSRLGRCATRPWRLAFRMVL